jgi:hypothetical protein
MLQTQILSDLLDLIDSPLSFDLVVSNRMSAIWALSKYQTVVKDNLFHNIFQKDQRWIALYDNKDIHKQQQFLQYPQFTPLYTGKGKRLIVQKHFYTFQLGRSYETTPIAVPLYNIQQRKTELFSSYDKIHQDLSAADLMNAASAIVPYFPAVKIMDQMYMANIRSPIYYAFTEAQKLFGDQVVFRILNIDLDHLPTSTITTTTTIKDQNNNNNNISSWGLMPWLQYGLLDLLTNTATDTALTYKLLQLHNVHHRLLSLNLNHSKAQHSKNLAMTYYDTYKTDLTDFFQPHTSRAWSH